jgi:hypothetical protein
MLQNKEKKQMQNRQKMQSQVSTTADYLHQETESYPPAYFRTAKK